MPAFWPLKNKSAPTGALFYGNQSLGLRMEINLDLSGLLNRLTVQPGRLEHPLLHGVKSGVAEYRLAADQFRVMRPSVFPDRHLNHGLPAQAADFGEGGINRRHGLEDLEGLKF